MTATRKPPSAVGLASLAESWLLLGHFLAATLQRLEILFTQLPFCLHAVA